MTVVSLKPIQFSIDDTAVADYLAFAESDKILSVSEFMEVTKRELLIGSEQTGDSMPWSKTESIFRFRPGEITMWAGISGHKKSMITSQCVLWLLPSSNICVASLEMRPEKTIRRMLSQALGTQPSVRYAEQWINWATNRFYLYDQLDSTRSDKILAMVHAAATQFDCKHVVIDSLMKCMSGVNDNAKYGAQTDFLNSLSQLAKHHNIHIHLVHHMRKGESEEKIPDKWSVRGASEITDQLDNLIIVHCNKRKERIIETSKDDDEIRDAMKMRDMTLRIAKQRHGEWEGDIRLWFDKNSLQHVGEHGYGAMPWPAPGVSAF